MKPNHFAIFVLILLVSLSQVNAQKVETKGRFTNSIYAYVPPVLRGTEEQETNWFFYQYLRFQAKVKEYNNLTFHYNTRLLTNLQEDIPDDLRFRVNRLSLSATDLLSGFMDVELGRFFFHPGIVFGSLDGLNLVLKPGRSWRVQLYGGVESTLPRSYKIYNWDDAAVYGGAVKYFNLGGTDLQLAYMQKLHQNESIWQIAALNISNYTLKDWRFLIQGHYDMANNRLHRFYFSTRWTASQKLRFNMHLKQQHPQIYANSYYTRFDLSEYKQGGLGGSYYFTDEYSLSADFHYYRLGSDEAGQRVIVSFNDLNGSIGVVYETGDLGDELGFLINYGYEFIPGLIGSISIDYMRYRLGELYDYEDQIGNALRASYSFADHWKVVAEYQILRNMYSTADQRFLNHIHYIW